MRSPPDRCLSKTPGHAPACRQRRERTTSLTEMNRIASAARRPALSPHPRHLDVALHRPGAGDAARCRGRVEGHAVVPSSTLLAGRRLVFGLIILGTLLGLMGGEAGGRRGAAERHDDLVGTPSDNLPPERRMVLAARRGQPNAPGFGPPAKPGRRTTKWTFLIDVYQCGFRQARPRHLPARRGRPGHARNRVARLDSPSLGRARGGPQDPSLR